MKKGDVIKLIESKAAALIQKSDVPLTKQQGFARVWRQSPELRTAYAAADFDPPLTPVVNVRQIANEGFLEQAKALAKRENLSFRAAILKTAQTEHGKTLLEAASNPTPQIAVEKSKVIALRKAMRSIADAAPTHLRKRYDEAVNALEQVESTLLPAA